MRIASRAVALGLVLLSLGAAAVDTPTFGTDMNPGAGPALVKEVRPALLAIVRARAGDREAAVEAFFPKADGLCEAWKRFRNPELKPLFVRLLGAGDWRTRHRALLALEYYRDPTTLPDAWKLLTHVEPRLQEKAAIACIKIWDKGAVPLLNPKHRATLEELRAAEKNPHLKACFEALQRRIDGTLNVVRMSEEFLQKEEDGLLVTPFLDGWDTLKTVAPGYKVKPGGSASGPSALKLPVADTWLEPVLTAGKEVVVNGGLQAFGDPEPGNFVHVGHDYAACLDGAGIYAVADGVVKNLWGGFDVGNFVVVEHHVDEKRIASVVYMYAGDTMFVKDGEQVKAGQLLGTVGMGFSIENGGGRPHVHVGAYRGLPPAVLDHTHEDLKTGLLDWVDPKVWLRRWSDGRPPGAEETTASLLERAGRLRKDGYPSSAIAVLAAAEKARKGTPAGAEIAAAAKAWREDAAFKRALAGESRVEELEKAAAKPGRGGGPKLKKAWESMLTELGDSELGPRIKDGASR